MNKYYTLVLNNCSDLGSHYITPDYCTMVPGVIENIYTELSTLRKDFLELDDTIIIGEKDWHITGSFPVIGIMMEEKIYDVITGKEIPYSKNPKEVNGLSYCNKLPVSALIAHELLSLLSEEERQKYVAYMEKLELINKKKANNYKFKETYFLLKPSTINADISPIVAKHVNGEYIDVFTKTKLIETRNDIITSKLSFRLKREISLEDAKKYQLEIIESGIDQYLLNIAKAKNNAKIEYDRYIRYNMIEVLCKKKTK